MTYLPDVNVYSFISATKFVKTNVLRRLERYRIQNVNKSQSEWVILPLANIIDCIKAEIILLTK